MTNRFASPTRSFLVRHKRLGAALQGLLLRFPSLGDRVSKFAVGDPQRRYREWVAAYDTIGEADLASIRELQSGFTEQRLLSLITAVGGAPPQSLEALASSLLSQTYEHWELHIVGDFHVSDGGSPSRVGSVLEDPRFRQHVHHATSVSEAINIALRSAEGEFAVLVDAGTTLRPHSLFLLAHTIEEHPDTTLIYGDEDDIDERGVRSSHYFKPDWNQALFLSQNYLGGLVAFRRDLAIEVGGCHDELDGNHFWGLLLRMTACAPPGTIRHLPYILCHRTLRLGLSETDDQRRVVAQTHAERLTRLGDRVDVTPVGKSSYSVRYPSPDRLPKVSVIVPSTCKLGVLRPCLDGVMSRTSYNEMELLLVANGVGPMSAEQEGYLDALADCPRARVLYDRSGSYNFSRLNNWAAGQARGELLCFLNDDTEVIEDDWLSAMVARARQARVGAVGAMLYYANDRIQHAGVVLGVGGIAAHTYTGRRRGTSGYHDRALVDQDVSCVTAACMLVRANAFREIGGFDESLPVAFNDVDFCLRLSEAGWRITWTPAAELYHHESASIGRHNLGKRQGQWAVSWDVIRSRWSDRLLADPHYSPNLSLDGLEVWQPAFPPRVTYPWKAPPGVPEASAQTSAPSLGRR